MDAISFIAEQKIEQAIADGQFDRLPGMGAPLNLEDLSRLPPELRMAYTILKNSGYIGRLPETGRDIAGARELLESCPDEGLAYGKMRKLEVMFGRVRRAQGEKSVTPETGGPEAKDGSGPYLDKLISRL